MEAAEEECSLCDDEVLDQADEAVLADLVVEVLVEEAEAVADRTLDCRTLGNKTNITL